MFVRVTQSVKDYGQLVKPSEVLNVVDDPNKDWYQSPFIYGEDALEYFQNNKNSIKGYTGDVWTDSLYWDLDYEGDLEVAKDATIDLVNFLMDLGYEDSIEVYFSGNKGFHIYLRTSNKFTYKETKRICHNIASEVGLIKLNKELKAKLYDPTVYNVNRIFRIENTKHPKSGLFKIQLYLEDLELDIKEIKKLAKKPSELIIGNPADASELKEKYKEKAKPKLELVNNIIDIEQIKSEYTNGFNPLDCPPDKRRCIYILENGFFGPGERENASIRLAAYYQGMGWTQEQTFEKIFEALEKREQNYDDLNEWTEADIWRVVEEVFSENWNGGMYSCKDDEFLADKCDLGNGPCCTEKKKRLNVVTIGGLIDQYIQYGMEALEDYPKIGLGWLDSMIRFRPRNYSIVNGANGSGKTSFLVQWMENLNEQKMYHILFSADMANTSLFEKIGARHTEYSQIEIEKAFNKHTMDKEIQNEVIEVLKEQYPYTIFDFTSALTSHHIEDTIVNIQDNGYKVQIAFIDYAGRVIGDHDSQYQNATQIALEGNDIAKRTSTHLCYISQVPREEGDHTRPLRSSRVSKDSGAWEENATIVLNLWRPFGDGLDDLDEYIHFYVAKNRSGSLGEHVFAWSGKEGNISSLSEQNFETYRNLCELHHKDPPKEQYSHRNKDMEKIKQSGRFIPKEEGQDNEDTRRKQESSVSNGRKSKRSRRDSKYSRRGS